MAGLLRFVTMGSVDDGKSTLIGRLLHDASAVHEDQWADVRRASRSGAPDLAFLTDGLRAEREQGITIDVAYRHFATPRRRFIIADTPGHEQYTRNMATGASTASVAVLLADVRKGVLAQTRRHAYIAALLGIRRMGVAVNKMDLVEYSRTAFEAVRGQMLRLGERLGIEEVIALPVSALEGENVTEPSTRMPWFDGPSLLEYLENVPLEVATPDAPFRFPVQYVVRAGDFRGYAGQIASGSIRVGSTVMALPSGRTATVREIDIPGGGRETAVAPLSVTLTLGDHLDVARGDMLVDPDNPPASSRTLRVRLVWMAAAPLRVNGPYLVKHTSQTVCGEVVRIESRTDIGTLEPVEASELRLNEIGTVDMELHRPIFVDPYSANRATGGFILMDPVTNETVAAGMVAEPRAEGSEAAGARTAANGHPGMAIWFTGLSSAGKTTLSRAVYERLWARGYRVEVLDGDVVRQHLSKDLGFTREDRDENIRRIGFLAGLLARNGVIVLVSAISPYRATRDEVRGRIGNFVEVYVNAPLEICEQRDTKGLYRKARAGELHGMTGIDDPYEQPLAPEVECCTDRETVAECVDKVLRAVDAKMKVPGT